MRLIDADALDDVIQTLNDKNWDITRADYKMIDAVLFEFPTIEERKRCKDCKHYKFLDKRCEWTGYEDVGENDFCDDFCSRAERRTDDN